VEVAFGILLAVVGIACSISSLGKGEKGSDEGNIAAVLWQFPFVFLGLAVAGQGISMAFGG